MRDALHYENGMVPLVAERRGAMPRLVQSRRTKLPPGNQGRPKSVSSIVRRRRSSGG